MRSAAYHKIWAKIHQQAKKHHLPLRVMFELTYRCNFNCRHCYVPKSWRRRKELNTAGVFDIIRQLKVAGCFFLGFTGGEIFLRPDIWQILEFSRRQGMQVILYTNASLINEQAAERIAAIGVNKVDITLPGISETVFDGLTRLKGSSQAVFSAIDYLRKYKVALGFKTCLLKANRNEIRAIEHFCDSLNCEHRLDNSPSPRIDKLIVNLIDPPRSFKCGGGITQCAITPDGRVKVCPGVEWPKIRISRENDFCQIWARLPGMIKDGECYKLCPYGWGWAAGERCSIQ
jgi:MoaA/NifB/PqqE/SkfB family radical SAM enzyme